MWNPPVIDERSMTRRSVLSEAAELLADLVVEGVRTICFLRSRRGIELIQRFTRMRLEELGRAGARGADRPLPRRLHARSSGARSRRGWRRGELLAVVATDALELGIDIGELDAAICVTFPGTVASLRQMWGRAGRRSEGLAVYVAGEDALDQFFCRHPDEFLERPVEAAILDHENERIQLAHLLAAAYEVPLGARPTRTVFGDALARARRARWSAPASCGAAATAATCRAARGFPAGRHLAALGLAGLGRGGRARLGRAARRGRGRARLHDRPSRAPSTCTSAAPTRSRELDVEARRAIVDRFDGDWYTQPKKETEVYIERVAEQRDDRSARASS